LEGFHDRLSHRIHTNANPERKRIGTKKLSRLKLKGSKNPSWHHSPASNWTQNITKCHRQKARWHSKPRAAFVRHAMLHQNSFDTEEDDKIEAS